jgi:7-cyano-7-deazaguanine synthase in queuosine biosynthesis
MLQNGIEPTEAGLDILCLATAVYLADTRISRELHSQGSWTREIYIELPVGDLMKFCEAKPIFERMLDFLTGDKWIIDFTQKEIEIIEHNENKSKCKEYEVASLFSGGMDSLISTINYLEQDKKVILVSHAGESFTKNSQKNILSEFTKKYQMDNILYLDLWMVFNKDFLPEGGNENSTRSRSFLFIAFGIFVISNIHSIKELQVPENGLIALNIPMDDLRIGSHSTRTTHPFYLTLWNEVLETLGTGKFVINPYWNKTKGEMANECFNREYLFEIIDKSNSCSSPIKATRKHLSPQHCGYCVPCIIRRAAMNKAFGIEGDRTVYTADDVASIVRNHSSGEGIQLRSFQYAINRLKNKPSMAKLLVYKTGAIIGDDAYINELSEVYMRGLFEVDAFIKVETEDAREDI